MSVSNNLYNLLLNIHTVYLRQVPCMSVIKVIMLVNISMHLTSRRVPTKYNETIGQYSRESTVLMDNLKRIRKKQHTINCMRAFGSTATYYSNISNFKQKFLIQIW